ncbi:molecular chaperone HtpG [Rhodovibrionaceae bacterium A322]
MAETTGTQDNGDTGRSPGEGAETQHFQAEVSRLLDIVANALYSNRDVFLRELVSNASDACDRLRYAALTAPELLAEEGDFAITLATDDAGQQLVIADNGIGLNKDDMISNLGTIARSGTAKFMEQLGEQKGEVDLIGQFGVGFYSAFMVADQVTVSSQKAGEDQGWCWTSDGKGSFTVVEDPDAPLRGTRITLHLKDDAREFLDANRLRQVIKTYSDHIAVPIQLVVPAAAPEEGETAEAEATEGLERLNSDGALWIRPKSDITDEQYKEFYHHVGHTFDDPWTRLHFKAEGVIEYSGLLYIPSMRPPDLFDPERRNRVKLYVKRVFITDNCDELLPSYLRFLRGVVDSEDLPLNISRELLQHNPVLSKMRSALVKRVLGELEKKADKAPEEYAKFWETFGSVLKEGIYEDEGQREQLMKLARFRSTAKNEEGEGDLWVSLEEYVARMKPGQKAIYTLSGEDLDALKRSPQLEGFLAKGVEVLLLTDPVDEFWMPMIGAFQDKPFTSITRGGADLDELEGDDKEAADSKDDAAEDKEDAGADLTVLSTFFKDVLGDKVKEVRESKRLTTSAVCLVADDGDMDLHLARLMRQHKEISQTVPRILELNPKHALIASLAERAKTGKGADALEDAAFLLLDQARILDGEAPLDPVGFSQRLAKMMERGMI